MPVNRIQQANYNRLNAMAQKGPLGQTSQRSLDYATKKLGLNNQPQMPIGNFQGDTSVPNLNTIGFPAPRGPVDTGMGPVDTGMPKATPTGLPYNLDVLNKLNPSFNTSPPPSKGLMGGGTPPAGPGAGLMGGSTPPVGGGFSSPTAGPPPPGMMFKKGGKVKKMASGGITSKPSSASKRADGIATRGKTKCKMY